MNNTSSRNTISSRNTTGTYWGWISYWKWKFSYSLCDVASSTTGLHQASDRFSWARRRRKLSDRRVPRVRELESQSSFLVDCWLLHAFPNKLSHPSLKPPIFLTTDPPHLPFRQLPRRLRSDAWWSPVVVAPGRYVANWVAKFPFPVWDSTSIIFNLLDD